MGNDWSIYIQEQYHFSSCLYLFYGIIMDRKEWMIPLKWLENKDKMYTCIQVHVFSFSVLFGKNHVG